MRKDKDRTLVGHKQISDARKSECYFFDTDIFSTRVSKMIPLPVHFVLE